MTCRRMKDVEINRINVCRRSFIYQQHDSLNGFILHRTEATLVGNARDLPSVAYQSGDSVSVIYIYIYIYIYNIYIYIYIYLFIGQMGQILLLPIHRRLPIGFRLMYLHLTFANSKSQSQGHLQFDCENSMKLSHTVFRLMSAATLPFLVVVFV